MKKNITLISLVFSLLVVVGCSQMLVSGQNKAKNERGIEGVWRTQVTPRNCGSGDALAPAFPGILMFDQDGTMTGTSTAAASVYGTWTREQGPKQYSFSTLSFKYDVGGNLTGSRNITQNVTMDESGNSFTSSGSFQDYNIAGDPTISGCSTATGTRF